MSDTDLEAPGHTISMSDFNKFMDMSGKDQLILWQNMKSVQRFFFSL